MRGFTLGIMAAGLLCASAAEASTTEKEVPPPGFLPLHKTHSAVQGSTKAVGLPIHEQKFLPLAPHGEARMFPLNMPVATPAEGLSEAALATLPGTRDALTQDNAKLLLSIFGAGD